MYVIVVAVILLVGISTEARVFQEPVLDNGDYPDPGVILDNGVYYASTTTNNHEFEKYPIFKSTDLQHWEKVGHIFDQDHFPSWSDNTASFWAPDLRKIGDQYVAYFTAGFNHTGTVVIGAATSKNVEGPYTPLPKPLHATNYVWDSAVIQHENVLMLVWIEDQYVRVRNLTEDGLAWKDSTVVALFQHDIPWEENTVEGPWHIFRNNWHYMFYSGNNFCSENYALGVARSRSPAGPYEKYSQNPILVSNDQFKGPGHGGIVPDLVNGQWAFVHHGWRAGQVCGGNSRYMFTTSMEFGDDDWPKKMSIGN